MSDEDLRLRKLIEHWADHNDEHGGRFEEEAKKALERGLEEVAYNLKAAAVRAAEVSKALRKALEAFS